MKISISTNIFGRSDITGEHLDIASAAGFNTLDFCAYYYVGQRNAGFYSPHWKRWIESLRSIADRRGVAFNQTHNAVFNYFTPCESQTLNRECVKRIIEATAMLGAKTTVCHPVAPEGMIDNKPECLKYNRDFFLRTSDIAEKFGVTLCIENMKDDRFFDGRSLNRYCTRSEELIELVDSINRPNVKVCVDLGHAHFMGEPPHKMIEHCGDRLAALHIHDNDTWSDQHLLPYCGTINWEAVTDALVNVNYPGDFTLETQHSFCHLHPDLFPENLRYAHSICLHLTNMIRTKQVERRSNFSVAE